MEGDDPSYLRSAGEEALDEIERIEEQLSFFIGSSEISWINRAGYPGPLKVEPRLLSLISKSVQICKETGGAFDITVTPLLSCWGIMDRKPRIPKEEEIRKALELVGPENVEIDIEGRSIRFLKKGVSISLGGIGKGYAIWRAAKVLEEKLISSAIISGGRSTIYALSGRKWKVGITDPLDPKRRIAALWIKGMAISTSSTIVDQKPHIVDPRTGRICEGVRSVSVICEDPVMADALSTAFLVMGPEEVASFCKNHGNVAALFFPSASGGIERIGMDIFLEEV